MAHRRGTRVAGLKSRLILARVSPQPSSSTRILQGLTAPLNVKAIEDGLASHYVSYRTTREVDDTYTIEIFHPPGNYTWH